jgi:hypothetical protein
VNADGGSTDQTLNCTGSGTVRLFPLGATLDYFYTACAQGDYTFGTGAPYGVATRKPNAGSPFELGYGDLELTGPGIAAAPNNRISGSATCKVMGTTVQCVTKPPDPSELRAGYDAVFSAAQGSTTGTFSCECFEPKLTLVISFTGFGPTSGTARVFATDGYVDVTRKSAGFYDVTIVPNGGPSSPLSDVQPL